MGMLGPPTPRCRQEHTHAPKPEDGIVRNSICAMKEAARTTTRPLNEIYEEQAVGVANTHPTAAPSLPLVSSVASSMYRGRRQAYPPLPQGPEDLVNMPDVFWFTGPQSNEQFLISNTLQAGEEGSLLFLHWNRSPPTGGQYAVVYGRNL